MSDMCNKPTSECSHCILRFKCERVLKNGGFYVKEGDKRYEKIWEHKSSNGKTT